MKDPIKKIIKAPHFNVYIWDDDECISVSFNNEFTVFRDLEHVEAYHEVCEAILAHRDEI